MTSEANAHLGNPPGTARECSHALRHLRCQSMLVRELLPKLKLGSSVAEHDQALAQYFIETETFRALVQGECDIVAGDKGTGKTALYRILEQRYGSMAEMRDIEVIAAFNPVGNPVFQRLTEN